MGDLSDPSGTKFLSAEKILYLKKEAEHEYANIYYSKQAEIDECNRILLTQPEENNNAEYESEMSFPPASERENNSFND